MRTERATEDAVFIFAHQDDEIGALTRVRWEVLRGTRVWCCFLTDGASAVPAAVRDAESCATLQRAGVDRTRIAFVGGEDRVPDGALCEHAERALREALAWARAIPNAARVYTLDWEGGHADHDAAHVISIALAQELGVREVFAYALYNGWRRRPGWFRVTSFVPAPGEVLRRRLRLWEALAPVRAIFAYPSQRRTWIGLGPGLLVRALWYRQERIRRVAVQRVSERPHAGGLLYETMFRVPAERVMERTHALRTKVLERAASSD